MLLVEQYTAPLVPLPQVARINHAAHEASYQDNLSVNNPLFANSAHLLRATIVESQTARATLGQLVVAPVQRDVFPALKATAS